jgi:hypothetical protein
MSKTLKNDLRPTSEQLAEKKKKMRERAWPHFNGKPLALDVILKRWSPICG